MRSLFRPALPFVLSAAGGRTPGMERDRAAASRASLASFSFLARAAAFFVRASTMRRFLALCGSPM